MFCTEKVAPATGPYAASAVGRRGAVTEPPAFDGDTTVQDPNCAPPSGRVALHDVCATTPVAPAELPCDSVQLSVGWPAVRLTPALLMMGREPMLEASMVSVPLAVGVGIRVTTTCANPLLPISASPC